MVSYDGAMERTGRRIGRPRDGRVDEAIVRAVRDLPAETGYAALTMDAVARRAGVGKAAIYRRYATKQEMVLAATLLGEPMRAPADTGSLLGDLTALARAAVGRLGAHAARGTMLSLLGQITADSALTEKFTRVVVEPERAGIAEVLRRAVRRGELSQLPDLDLFHAMVGGTVLFWLGVARCDPRELPERLARFVHAALLAADREPAPAAHAPQVPA